jgi:hypothetical protein
MAIDKDQLKLLNASQLWWPSPWSKCMCITYYKIVQEVVGILLEFY